MTRQTMLVAAALGGLALAMPPMCAQAQSGDALVRAEYVCFENGVRPNSPAFNVCVDRAARAFDRGEPEFRHRATRKATLERRVPSSSITVPY
jgi:hypothetical protein